MIGFCPDLLLLRKLCPLKKTSFEKVFQRLQSFQIKLMAQSQNSFPVAFFNLMFFYRMKSTKYFETSKNS